MSNPSEQPPRGLPKGQICPVAGTLCEGVCAILSTTEERTVGKSDAPAIVDQVTREVLEDIDAGKIPPLRPGEQCPIPEVYSNLGARLLKAVEGEL